MCASANAGHNRLTNQNVIRANRSGLAGNLVIMSFSACLSDGLRVADSAYCISANHPAGGRQ